MKLGRHIVTHLRQKNLCRRGARKFESKLAVRSSNLQFRPDGQLQYGLTPAISVYCLYYLTLTSPIPKSVWHRFGTNWIAHLPISDFGALFDFDSFKTAHF